MIAFASLFLGLVLGVQPVEVVVGEGVVAVEILLNGRSLGMIRGEPWSIDCDLGTELAPQELEAVAYDAEQQEIGRVRQWLNLPQAPAVASIVLEPHQEGQPRLARLAWESIARTEPKAIAASFDGKPLRVDDPRRIVLPAHDAKQLHFLRAELDFGFNVSSLIELIFGGTYADEISTEMTAIPVLAEKKKREPPPAETFQGWFLSKGKPLQVVAVEKGPAELVVVMNRPLPSIAAQYTPRPRAAAPLPRGLRLRFLIPVPQSHQGVVTPFSLFPTSEEFTGSDGGLYWLLSRVHLPALLDEKQRLADAVAVAGLAAYERRRRRGVLLILSAKPDVAGQLRAAQTRRYLELLKVPLFLWTPDGRPSPELADWGEPVDISSIGKLTLALSKLAEELDRQWIVWLDGTYLPQEITLAPEAEGITMLR
ncbi:MAG: hypothetical protein GY856_03355 [bacterium]|nr:hypothetical protein [bacterium]